MFMVGGLHQVSGHVLVSYVTKHQVGIPTFDQQVQDGIAALIGSRFLTDQERYIDDHYTD